jgi:hypothetical protein
MRDNGVGVIDLVGVGTGTVTRALLYWHGPTRLIDPTANSTVTFAGTTIYGTNIGFSADNCWGYDNSQAYRADVTSLVRGDGQYELADFFKPAANVNGVSLVAFFDDGNANNNFTAYLFDSNDSNIDNPFEGANWNQTYANIDYSGTGTVTLELHVADGQTFADEAVYLNQIELFPAGPNFEGTTVPSGPFQTLWDIRQFPVTRFFTRTGTNTIQLTTNGVNSDCLSLIAAIFLVPVP